LFNNISISRAGTPIETFKIPINFAPMQKFLAKIQQDTNLDSPAIVLPRMSFELMGMNYDPDRKISSTKFNLGGIADPNRAVVQYVPAPYNLNFQLNIMAKYLEDGTKILEQILPYFQPAYTVSAKIIDNLDYIVDIPIVLNSVNLEDAYDSSFEERRVMIWTLQFTMKAYYYGPNQNKKLIKFAEANTDIDRSSLDIDVRPGLTAGGLPTTSAANSIPWQDIEVYDDWGTIIIVDENE
jgi:hypothetical protein